MEIRSVSKVRIVTHYFEDDPECVGDYTSIDVFFDMFTEPETEPIASYGDSYHDNGQEKVAGFLDALYFLLGPSAFTVERENVADYY